MYFNLYKLWIPVGVRRIYLLQDKYNDADKHESLNYKEYGVHKIWLHLYLFVVIPR